LLDFFGAFGDIRRFKSVCGELCPGAKAARFFVVAKMSTGLSGLLLENEDGGFGGLRGGRLALDRSPRERGPR
jgi:hypothetical protein